MPETALPAIRLSSNLDITSGRQYRQTEVKKSYPGSVGIFLRHGEGGPLCSSYHGRYVFVL